MKEKNYTICRIDPESTVGLAVANAIETAKKQDMKVVIYLRDTACVVTKHTKLFEGIECYRKAVEKFTHSRN